MAESASEFRRAVAARNRGEGVKRRRFGADLRARAVALAAAMRREGQPWQSIASELEVNATLLQKWCEQGTGAPFVLVELEEQGKTTKSGAGVGDRQVGGALRLCTPSGYVIEGLDVVAAAELLRRLP